MVLTQTDLDQIEDIVDSELEARTSNLPTKKEFFKAMDEVMGELKTIREEEPLISHRVADHEERIVKLEKRVDLAIN